MTQNRLIIYHKQATSARTLFLQLEHGGVCGIEQMPKLTALVDDAYSANQKNNVRTHPAPLLKRACEYLALQADALETDSEFHALLDAPGTQIDVYLARVTTMDPPYEHVKKVGASFVPLTALRNLPPTELELLREAYKVILG